MDNIFYELRLFFTKNIGNMNYRLLVKKCGSAQNALEFLEKGMFCKSVQIPSVEQILQHIEIANIQKTRIISETSDLYPHQLKLMNDSPVLFFCKGKKPELLHKSSCAIIGSRSPALYTIQYTRQTARNIVAQKIPIISGMAMGVDSVAHEESIETGTIAVLAGGVDVVYPEHNQILYERILETGCVVSLQPCGKQPASFLFPVRNKFLASLCSAAIVMEATEKSGSLITARFVQNYNKPLWVVPGHPLDPRFHGNRILLTENANLFFAELNPWALFSHDLRDSSIKTEPIIPDFSEQNIENIHKVFSLIGLMPASIYEISRETGLDPSQVMSVLLLLSLENKIQFHENWYVSRI